MIIFDLSPLLTCVELIIGLPPLVLVPQPFLRRILPLAVLLHNPLDPMGHVGMNENPQAVLIVC